MWIYTEVNPDIELATCFTTQQELGRVENITWSFCNGESLGLAHETDDNARKFYGGLLDDLTKEVEVQGLNTIKL